MTVSKKKNFFTASKELDMTQGSIFKNIISFAIPLIIGNLFQQLYNMVDTWVIGQTRNTGAYAAVGSVGPIINILIGFFSGLASGAGVVISQYYGAKDKEAVKKSVHTSVAFTLVFAVLFTVLGIVFAPFMLKIMLKTTGEGNEIFDFANQYLTIYFAGVTGLLIYNMGSGILRAVGDSLRPLLFLVASAVTNTVLDLVFVFKFDMGAAGVAWATIIAQFISAILVCVELLRSDSWVKVSIKDIKIDKKILGKIVKIGIPAALQMALTAFSNVFVQSYIGNINGVQKVNLGSWTTYSKADQIIFLPITSIALAVTTFVGQNLGAGNVKRARKGTKIAYFMSTGFSVCLMIPVIIFAPYIARLFNSDPEVVERATILLRVITPFYLFCSINQVLAASLRGSGNSKSPMIFMLCSFIGIRQLYLFIMSNFISNEMIPIAISYPVGWFCCSMMMLAKYLTFDMEKFRVANDIGKKNM